MPKQLQLNQVTDKTFTQGTHQYRVDADQQIINQAIEQANLPIEQYKKGDSKERLVKIAEDLAKQKKIYDPLWNPANVSKDFKTNKEALTSLRDQEGESKKARTNYEPHTTPESLLANAQKYKGSLKSTLALMREDAERFFEDTYRVARSQYLRPGVRDHSGIQATYEKQKAAYMRNLDKEIAALEERQHEKALGFAERTSDRKLSAEQLYANMALHDAQRKQGAVKAHQEAMNEEKKWGTDAFRQEKDHINEVAKENQSELDLHYKTWRDEQETPQKRLESLTAILHGAPAPHAQKTTGAWEAPSRQHDASTYANVFGSLGQHLMGIDDYPLHYKQGGVLRHPHAEGDTTTDNHALLQKSIEDALTHHIDPIRSLSDLVTAQPHAHGDRVSNPIQEGAEKAQAYALRDKVLRQADEHEQLEPHQEVPFERGLIAALARGLSVGNEGNTLGGFAKTLLAGEQEHKDRDSARAAHKRAQRQAKAESAKTRHVISKDILHDLATDKALDIKNRHEEAMLAHQGRALNHQQLADTLALERHKQKHGAPGVERPLTIQEYKELDKYQEKVHGIEQLLAAAKELKELNAEGISGSIIGGARAASDALTFGAGNALVSGVSGIPQEKLDRFAKLENQLANFQYKDIAGGRGSIALLQSVQRAKPSLKLDPQANDVILDDIIKFGESSLKDAGAKTARFGQSPHEHHHVPEESGEAPEEAPEAAGSGQDHPPIGSVDPAIIEAAQVKKAELLERKAQLERQLGAKKAGGWLGRFRRGRAAA